MRRYFEGYYQLTPAEFRQLWKRGTFVLDANVLLSYYRFSSLARRDLLNAITKIKNRLWIPFHAQLEFQINRNSEIQDQLSAYDSISAHAKQLNDAVLQLKRRHSSIYDEAYKGRVENTINGFIERLEELKRRHHPKLGEADSLRDEIDKVISGACGEPPKDDTVVRGWIKEAETRATSQIPPGFKDLDKQGSHSYGPLSFPRKYGDYFFWKQFLTHATTKKLEFAIMVTGDVKEDWFEKSKSQSQIIGPHPNLLQEARQAGLKLFHIYTVESFLRYSEEYLETEVSQASIEEARQLGKIRDQWREYSRLSPRVYEEAVLAWLIVKGHQVSRSQSGLHWIATSTDGTTFVPMVDYWDPTLIGAGPVRLAQKMHFLQEASQDNIAGHWLFVVAAESQHDVAAQMLSDWQVQDASRRRFTVGRLVSDEGVQSFQAVLGSV